MNCQALKRKNVRPVAAGYEEVKEGEDLPPEAFLGNQQ